VNTIEKCNQAIDKLIINLLLLSEESIEQKLSEEATRSESFYNELMEFKSSL